MRRTMARNDGVQILDVRVEGIPEGLVASGIIGSLGRSQAERIRCRTYETPSRRRYERLRTIEAWVDRTVQMLPDGLHDVTGIQACEPQVRRKECRCTYGGMCTNAREPLVSSAGPHTESISFVSSSIQVATDASTQSGSGAELAPADQPPRESNAHRMSAGRTSEGISENSSRKGLHTF